MFKLVTRGETIAEIYSCYSDSDLQPGKIVKLVDMNDSIGATFKVADAGDDEKFVALIVHVDEFDSKKGTVMDLLMNRGILFETDNFDSSDFAGWNVGDLVGVKGGKFFKVDGTSVTNPVARVVKLYSDSAVLQAL